jgi:hypothetical protein
MYDMNTRSAAASQSSKLLPQVYCCQLNRLGLMPENSTIRICLVSAGMRTLPVLAVGLDCSQ